MNSETILFLSIGGYVVVAVVAIFVNDATHRAAHDEQRIQFINQLHNLSVYADSLQSSNTVLLARQAQLQTEIAGLLDANFELQQDNEQLYSELNSDAEFQKLMGDYS